MTRRTITRGLWLSIALAGTGALAWWALIGSARVPPLPPLPPDEGQEGRLHQAYLESLLRRRPGHWQARANLAARYSQDGRDAEATRHLREAVRLRPADAHLLRALAYAAGRAGLMEEQLRAWTQLARRDRGDLEARLRLAELYRRLAWDNLALVAAEECLRLAPTDPDVLRAHAVVNVARGDYRAAARSAQKLVRVDPRSAVGHSIVAACYRQQGAWARATAEAEEAVREAPQTLEYHIDLARLYMERPDGPLLERALSILNAAPAGEASQELARRYWRGVCRHRMGQADAAIADLSLVYDNNLRFEEVTYFLGKTYQQRGDTERARRYATEYDAILRNRIELLEAGVDVRRNMGSARAHLRMARAALAAGEPARAALECQVALRLRPGDRAAGRVLQEARQRIGQGSHAG